MQGQVHLPGSVYQQELQRCQQSGCGRRQGGRKANNMVTGPITNIYLRKDKMPTKNYPGVIHVSIETEEDIGSGTRTHAT